MQSATHSPRPGIHLRIWLLFVVASLLAARAGVCAPIYSTGGVASASSTCILPLGLCNLGGLLGGGVDNADLAADGISNNYATIYKFASLGSGVKLRVGLDARARPGDRAGLLVALDASILSTSALGTYTLRTYLRNSPTVVETQVVSAAVVQSLRVLAGAGRPVQLEFVAAQPFDDIELEVAGAVDVLYRLRVYNAYAVEALVQQPVQGLLSRFTVPDLSPFYSTAVAPGNLGACVNTDVLNPANAVDGSLTNYAQFGTFVSVSCPSTLAVKLENLRTAPAGYYAGFVLGTAGLIDVTALSNLRLTTYKTSNGVRTKQESASGPSLLDLNVLPNGKFQVSFPTTLPFDEVQVEQLDVLAVLSDLKIYHGFGIEPSAFIGSTRILSDFDQATSSTKVAVSISGVACVLCGVATPEGAADSNPTTKAVLNVTLGLATSVELKVGLRGTGVAGYRAGMVISSNTGLLDVSLLDRLTLTTYGSDGQPVESASGSALLALNVLPDGRQELSFLTTRDFASVQLSTSALAGLGVNINIFQAFADNLASGLFTTITAPLPVELTAFTGRWVAGAAELSWNTASERNSSHFVVERSAGGDGAFRAVGQVTAAGNTTRAHTYQLRDAEASAQGVATLYYRLRQVDKDGRQAFSPLVTVAVGKLTAAAPAVEVYPNPAIDARIVSVRILNLPATGAVIQTYSSLGQLVSQVPVGKSTTRLELPALAPGLYRVVLRSASGQRLATQSLVVGGR